MLFRLFAFAALTAVAPLMADADFCVGGTIVNALTGEPLRRAAVTTPQSATLSDAAGAFRMCGLAAGSYYTNGEKPGYAPNGVRLMLGPSREDLVLRLQPLSVIKGKVLEAGGEPVANALIQLLSITTQNGRRKVKVETSVSTDDRGVYRLPGLSPGRYLVRAAGWQGTSENDSASSQNFVPMYYGGAPDLASASPLKLEAGRDEVADFTVAVLPSYRIRGKLANSSPQAAVKIELLGPEGDLSACPVTYHSATGTFEIASVAPGTYLLRATQGEGDRPSRGEQPVQVGSADVSDVLVDMSAPVLLRGTVRVVAASSSTPAPPACSIELSPAAASMSDATVFEFATGEDGDFEEDGVLPGRYRLRMDCASGYIAAAHAGDTDLLARNELLIGAGVAPSIEAVLNTDGGTVDVTASQDGDGDPPTAWFALVPDSGNDLHIRFALLKGKLSLPGVAPGDYHAYAWTGSPYEFEYATLNARQAWADRAASVHVTEREHESITVKVAPGATP